MALSTRVLLLLLLLAALAIACGGPHTCDGGDTFPVVFVCLHTGSSTSSTCCTALLRAVDHGGFSCLCAIGASPEVMETGHGATDLISWYQTCGGSRQANLSDITATCSDRLPSLTPGAVGDMDANQKLPPATEEQQEEEEAPLGGQVQKPKMGSQFELQNPQISGQAQQLPCPYQSFVQPSPMQEIAQWPWQAVVGLAVVFCTFVLFILGIVLCVLLKCSGQCSVFCAYLIELCRKARAFVESVRDLRDEIAASTTGIITMPEEHFPRVSQNSNRRQARPALRL